MTTSKEQTTHLGGENASASEVFGVKSKTIAKIQKASHSQIGNETLFNS